MKARQSFVSNSSSCSFTVYKNEISKLQYAALKDPKRFVELIKEFADFTQADYAIPVEGDVFEEVGWMRDQDLWFCNESHDKMEFKTTMDNFDMIAFAEMIGVTIHNKGW